MRTGIALLSIALLVTSGCLGFAPSVSDAGATPQDVSNQDGTSVRVTVTEVVDGDTMKVKYTNGSRDTVRLLGVDTPEVYGSNTPDEFEGVPDTEAGAACLGTAGENASAYAKARLSGQEVSLVFDETADRRGYYGRLLGYVYVDGQSFNYDLIETGHARVYDSTFTERERYQTAEKDARTAGRGLWSCAESESGGTMTSDGDNDGETTIEIVRVHPDADGNDNENPNGEYVVFRNEGEQVIDLSGWSVADAADNEYTFPSGTTLEPDAELTLKSGTGTDREGTVYWGRNSAVWNNGGDTITLRDADGTVVLERRY
ncbi:lamin tail domain-containing protein [Halogeometricum borinquense]|uniref:lamin tail domain-containing protein n=1 Tax=Halogeometricum borinquense TaxID=60847 RepID=UPI0034371865